jgi:hypothetical protein
MYDELVRLGITTHEQYSAYLATGRVPSGYGYTIGQQIAAWFVLRFGDKYNCDDADRFGNDVENVMLDADWLAFRNGTTFTRTFTPERKVQDDN